MELLTIAEIAKRLDLPESTVRYYRDRFAAYVPVYGGGRNRRYRAEALEVLRFIAGAMRAGLPADEVEAALRQRFPVAAEASSPPQQQEAAGQQQPSAVWVAWLSEAMATALDGLLARREAWLRQELATLREEVELARQQAAATAEMVVQLRQVAEQQEADRYRRDEEQVRRWEEREQRLLALVQSLQERKPWWRRWRGG